MLLAANLLQKFLLMTLHVIISNVMCRGQEYHFLARVNQQLIAHHHHHPLEKPPFMALSLVVGEPQLS
jgi:hypothetical protein